MKLINRLYFDFNATSPLAETVKSLLARGEVHFNSSSAHTSGKQAKKAVLATTELIQKIFSIKHVPIYHSGATEGINLVFQGRVKKLVLENQKIKVFGWGTDHSAVLSTIKNLGTPHQILPVKENGLYDLEALKAVIGADIGAAYILNVTWVNNETGVIQNISEIEKICQGHDVYIHVDAAQAVNKIPDWEKLSNGVDAYTFSAHKFGGLTGVGVTLLKNADSVMPLIFGGGQQDGLRGGTENVLGIVSLGLALQECFQHKSSLTEAPKKLIEAHLEKHLGEKIIVVGKSAPRNVNTMDIIWKGASSDQTLIHFDMQGMDISAGSACASGRLKESHVLIAMGYTAYKNNGLRFSFSPAMSDQEAREYSAQILSVFQSL